MAEPIAVAIVKEEIDDATSGALAPTIPAATSVSSGGDAPVATDDAMLAVSSASLRAEAGGDNSVVAEDNHVPDRPIIKLSLYYRAKYTTKRQEPKQNLMCWQLVPHPSNRGGEVIRSTRTKALAGDIFEVGYDPVEGTVDSVSVEVKVDSRGVLRRGSPTILRRILGWTRSTMSATHISLYSRP